MKKSEFAIQNALGIMLLMTFFSCQKELSLEPADPSVTTDNAGLLKKVVTYYLPENLDYLTYDYAYDNANRISQITITQKIKYSNNTVSVITGSSNFQRDTLGRITLITTLPDTSKSYVLIRYVDSISLKAASATIYRMSGAVAIAIDSTIFEYSADNRVIKTSQYFRQSNNSLKLATYQTYSYDTKGNILEKQLYQDDNNNGVFVPSLRYTWEYDNNENPRFQNDIALFYWGYNWPTAGSPANVIRQKNDYPNTQDDELNYAYQYNISRKPIEEKNIPDGNNITKYFYY
jgi:hypothetical protein